MTNLSSVNYRPRKASNFAKASMDRVPRGRLWTIGYKMKG
jgi:hypothetical protein